MGKYSIPEIRKNVKIILSTYLEALRLIDEYGLSKVTTVATVLTSKNFMDIPHIVNTLKSITGITHYRVTTFIPTGRGNLHKDLLMEQCDYEKFLEILIVSYDT